MDERYLQRHVLVPSSTASVFDTLSPPVTVRAWDACVCLQWLLQARVEDGRVWWSDVEQRAARVAMTETLYDEQYRAVRCVTVALDVPGSNAVADANATPAAPNQGHVPLTALPQPSEPLHSSGAELPHDEPEAALAALRAALPAVCEVFEERLTRLHELVSSTFTTAALARHGALVTQRCACFSGLLFG